MCYRQRRGLIISLTDNVLDNDQLQVDFKPLYECIHIYSALDSLDEIRRSYQADRKVLPKYSVALGCVLNRYPRRNQTSLYPNLYP